jgi:hypothetical protein
MTRQFPYLSEEAIERDAETLLAEYAQSRGVVIAPPIPIEDIVEKHLKLCIEFDDMHRLLDTPRSDFFPNIQGAIFFEDRRIVIDESLDPEENPSREHDYRCTLAHEGCGHWRLHRHLFVKDKPCTSFFEESAVVRVCFGDRHLELEADFHASCVLMPRKLVFAIWEEIFPDRKPRIVEQRASIDHPFVEVPRLKSKKGESLGFETNAKLLDRVACPLAQRFLVSPSDMRARLEKLGLLFGQVPLQPLRSAGA